MNQIKLASMAPPSNGNDDVSFLVWIDIERDLLCFDGRRIRLDALDHDDRAILRRISMLRDCATTSEFFDAVDRELAPLIHRLWRLTTH